MSRWFAAVPVVVLLALTVLFVGYALRHDPHVSPAALVGKPAPGVAMQPLGGGGLRAAVLPGQGPVLVNFFGSWCAPCVEEAPALMALKAQGVPIIGVAYKDKTPNTQAYLNNYGNPYQAILTDPTGRAGVEWGISGVPETFAVAASGKIVAKKALPLSPQDAEQLTESLGR